MFGHSKLVISRYRADGEGGTLCELDEEEDHLHSIQDGKDNVGIVIDIHDGRWCDLHDRVILGIPRPPIRPLSKPICIKLRAVNAITQLCSAGPRGWNILVTGEQTLTQETTSDSTSTEDRATALNLIRLTV